MTSLKQENKFLVDSLLSHKERIGALLAKVDMLEANQKLETDLRAQVDYATRLEKENEYLEDRFFKLQNRNIRYCREGDRYREALEKIEDKLDGSGTAKDEILGIIYRAIHPVDHA